MSDLPAIETFGLSKRYGRSRNFAVRDLDITVMPGEVYGFLGPNGSGKTTTIRLLMNFLKPTFGNAQILGRDIVQDSVAIKSEVGYLPGEVALYDKMTGRRFLAYMARLQPPKRRSYVENLVKLFEADVTKKIGQLSKGNRQKLGIIQAFMHEPAVLILDEPTDGLDPLMQEAFYDLVRKTSQQGATLFISSHNLTEVQKICDKAGFIRKGKLVAEQSIADLSHSAVQVYDIAFGEEVPLAALRKLRVKLKLNSDQHVTLAIRGELKPLLATLAKYQVVSLERREINLEEEFLKYYRSKSR